MKVSGSLIGLVVVGVLGVFLFASYVTNYNYGVRAEKAIEARYENLQNILGQYSLRVKEAAQVPGMQTQDLAELFTGALDARYGGDGANAAMLWIQEQNPNLDQSTYLQIQRIIEGGRNKFENAQTEFLDVKREYETSLGLFWKGTLLSVAGFPKIDLDEFTIVTSEYAEKSFETGIGEEIQLR